MPTEAKANLIAEFTEKLKQSNGTVVVDYRGLSMTEQSTIRSEAKKQQMEFKVIKNTILKLALQDSGIDELPADFLEGPTAILVSCDDVLSPAKLAVSSAKEYENLSVKGGFSKDGIFTEQEIEKLSLIPPREQLLAQVVGGINAPLTGLVSVLAGTMRGLVNVLDSYREQRAA